jgi:hypothetical protein
MQAHGISDPFDLTEFDQWVNDATRKDVGTIAAQHGWKVFGLKMWREWEKIRGKDLQGALNFSIDYVFKNEDEAKIDALIQKYEKAAEESWSAKLDSKTVDKISKLAILCCWWV